MRGNGQPAHHVEAHAFGSFNQPGAFAMGAIGVNRSLEAWPHALAGHFDDPKIAHPQHFGFGSIVLEFLVQFLFQLATMALVSQIDKVADDHTAQIAQPQLPWDLLGGFHIRFERGGLRVGVVAEFAAVDIDGDDCLGGVDHQRSTARQRNMPAVHHLDIFFDIVLVEKGNRILVKLDLVFRTRVSQLDHIANALGDIFIVDDNRFDIRAVHIAYRAGDEVAFGVQLHWAGSAFKLIFDHLPKACQIDKVALNFRLGFANASSADNKTDIFRGLQTIQNLTESSTFFIIFNLLGDALVGHARHHHENSTGDGQIAAESWALRADTLFDDLDDDFIAPAQASLDRWPITASHLAANRFLNVFTLAPKIGGHQVGDVQETVTTQSEVNEGGLD